MTTTLDEAERLTASRIGFFHFLNEDEKTIQLITWSTQTRKGCFIPKEPERHYPVDLAGVWVDCIRERRPVIHNDYPGLPHKKGLPDGHVALQREVVVPIFDGDRIVAIMGVGNKAEPYSEWDIDIISLLAKNAWTLIRRKRAEEELRESEERYHNLIDTSHDIIYSLSPDGVFLFVSPAWTEILGHPVADVAGRNFAEFVHPDDLPACYAFLRKVLEYGERQEGVEYRVRHLNGEWRWHTSSATPVQESAGGVARCTGIARDITWQRQAEEALRTANRKLNLLTSITRHDIKNQLLALKGYIELSEEELDNREKLSRFLALERKVADNIERQITFTKDYEDLGVKSAVWQDVSSLVRDAATSLPLGSISLENQCDGLEVYADPLLGKVFFNLIDNSLRYGGAGMTRIRIFPRQEGTGLQIVYEDDGCGIGAADKKKLFSKGFGKHTGLGLFLSREILSITGISIREEGEAGSGVRFVITVPAGMFRLTGA